MSIKGFPTTQKLVNNQSSRNDFATLQPQDLALRQALDTVARFAFRVNDETTPRAAGVGTGNPANNGGTIIVDTATPARVGDFVRFETGAAARLEIPIVDVNTNSFTLGARLPDAYAPASADTFFIMRYATQRVDANGSQQVSVSSGPIAYVDNGTDTEVELDTVTPGDTKALPVRQVQTDGIPVDVATEEKQDDIITSLATLNAVDFATQTTLSALNGKVTACNTGAVVVSTLPVAFNSGATNATTQRVILASDSPSPVQPVNTGSFAQITNLVASAQTLTAPAGAIGFKIQAPSANTENISFSIGAVATITAGILLEPGRSEDFDTGSNISVIATSAAAQTVNVLWKVRP